MANPADRWLMAPVVLRRREEALSVLQDNTLLKSFFDRLLEVITLIEAAIATAGFDTTLAWDMLKDEQLNVLVYGESGAGKSLLVRTLTGDSGAASSHSVVGTTTEEIFRTPSGVNFVDTPGIKIPLEAADMGLDGKLRHFRDRWMWSQMLRDLNSRLHSTSAAQRPLALVYVHRASHRVIADRIRQLLVKGHELLVPTFLLLTDVCGVDDAALAEVKGKLKDLVDAIGPNKRNHHVHLIDINTETKTVSGHQHTSRGLPQFVSTLLSNLDPIDALTFASTRSAVSLSKLVPGSQYLPLSQRSRVVDEQQKTQVRQKRGRDADAGGGGGTRSAAGGGGGDGGDGGGGDSGERPACRRRTL